LLKSDIATVSDFAVCTFIFLDRQTFQNIITEKHAKLEMWANAQRDGRPAEYRWRPLFNAAKFG